MKVLVTGSAGYIGSHIMLDLCRAGHQPIGVDRSRTSICPPSPLSINYATDIADSTGIADIVKRHGVTAAIHCAVRSSPRAAFAEPLKHYDQNVFGSRLLFQTLGDAGVSKIVLASTASIYGRRGSEPIAEGSAGSTLPTNPHGRSMLATEWVLRDLAAASGIDATVLRLFNVAGADRTGHAGTRDREIPCVMTAVTRAAIGLAPQFNLHGRTLDTRDGSALRDYVHVSDVARAFRLAVEALEADGQARTLNIGSGTTTSVIELVQKAEKLFATRIRVVGCGGRLDEAASLCADTTAALTDLGWTTRFGVVDMMLDTAAWERRRRFDAPRHADDMLLETA